MKPTLTQQQAIDLFHTEFWEGMSYEERAKFQLFEKRLCMPFEVFHEAVEKTLGRPVYTHEFASPDELRKELLDEKPPPTLTEILDMIPARKRVILVAS